MFFRNVLLPIWTLSAPLVRSQPANPISVKSVVNYGEQTSTNDGYIHRDGGGEGQIGNIYLVTFADTSQCTSDNSSSCGLPRGNSVAASTYVPYQVTDYGQSPGFPPLFCDSNSPNSRLHITNISPLTSTSAVTWYTNVTNSGSACGEIDGCYTSNGVASIGLNGGTPTCSPLFPFWDVKNEPLWGTPVGPRPDNYIYMIGQLDPNAPGGNLSDVYLARVLNGSTFDYSKYQYWNGTAFSPTRLIDPVTQSNGATVDRPAIIQNAPSLGSFSYNNYYQKYIILGVAANGSSIEAYTSTLPQGPWSAPLVIYTNSSYSKPYVPLYTPQAQTRFDTSGKTLVVTAADFNRNNIDVTFKVTFN